MDRGCGVDKAAKRTYLLNFGTGMAGYVVAIIGVAFMLDIYGDGLAQWVKILLSLVPIPPVIWAARAIIVHVRAMDEMQRQMRFEAAIMSLMFVAFATLTYGLMQGFAGLPKISMVWVLPAVSASYGIAELIIRRRYNEFDE